jgi:hypothetical protein
MGKKTSKAQKDATCWHCGAKNPAGYAYCHLCLTPVGAKSGKKKATKKSKKK